MADCDFDGDAQCGFKSLNGGDNISTTDSYMGLIDVINDGGQFLLTEKDLEIATPPFDPVQNGVHCVFEMK